MSLLAVSVAVAADEAKPLSSWITQLQTLAGKHRKGTTDVQTQAAHDAFLDALIKEHDGKVIQFTAVIKNVKWKEGVATITTDAEYGKLPAPTAAAPLSLFRGHPFELAMPEADALAIKPGTPFRFTGSVQFHRGQWGGVGPANKAQQLYTLRHTTLSIHYAGTFTSRDARFKVGAKEYRSKWADADKQDK